MDQQRPRTSKERKDREANQKRRHGWIAKNNKIINDRIAADKASVFIPKTIRGNKDSLNESKKED